MRGACSVTPPQSRTLWLVVFLGSVSFPFPCVVVCVGSSHGSSRLVVGGSLDRGDADQQSRPHTHTHCVRVVTFGAMLVVWCPYDRVLATHMLVRRVLAVSCVSSFYYTHCRRYIYMLANIVNLHHNHRLLESDPLRTPTISNSDYASLLHCYSSGDAAATTLL